MKVLWVTNLVARPGESVADPQSAVFGGWIATMAQALKSQSEIEISILVRTRTRAAHRQVLHGVSHYYVPLARRNKWRVDEAALRSTIDDAAPDILHIEGAEMPHALQAAHAFCGPVIVSVQGVLKGLEPYEFGGLPFERWALMVNRPRRAIMAAAHIGNKFIYFRPRLSTEAAVMARADHLIGRTQWDRAYCAELAPGTPYSAVGRILRPAFYEHRRAQDVRYRHSLFLGNANHPRKGAHVVVAALKRLAARFYDCSLLIAGEPPRPSAMRLKAAAGYPAHLAGEIEAAGLSNRVRYTGVLGAVDMAEAMASSHVFVLSSLIENSPNTLGEAMMLGMPAVCAAAGGAPDMAAPDREALFYRPEDPVCLTHQVSRIFECDALAASLGKAAAQRARRNHDPKTNAHHLLSAYEAVLSQSSPTRLFKEAA